MKRIKFFPAGALFGICLLSAISCSQGAIARSGPDIGAGIVLVGSTPGNDAVKTMLSIPADAKIDFIRWELTLSPPEKTAKTFSLDLNYGEGKPNTRNFIEDHKFSLSGKYEIARGADTSGSNIKADIYKFTPDKTADKPAVSFSLVKINDNIFHLLSAESTFMVGNGGWSYTLNRKQPAGAGASLPVLAKVPPLADAKTAQVIFVGRTPCAEIAAQFAIEIPDDCFKLKWKLTLDRDPKTFAPATYTLQRTHHRPTAIEGKWTMKEKAGAVIYQLDPDKPDRSLSFLLADENVMFFLDKNEQLFTGNGEFSYTMDKKPAQ